MKLFAAHALLPDGWARDVRIEVDDAGTIAAVERGVPPEDAGVLPGPLSPARPPGSSAARTASRNAALRNPIG